MYLFLSQDVVIMAEAVHKFFNEKLEMMPPDEVEISGKPPSKPVVKKATPTSSTPGDPGEEPPAKREKRAPSTRTRTTAAGKLKHIHT